MAAPVILLVSYWYIASLPLSLFGQRRYLGLPGLARALPAHGSIASAAEPTLPFHAWSQSCILGAQCLGSGYSFGSSSPEGYVVSQTCCHRADSWTAVASRGQLSGLNVNTSGVASTSRGLVGDTVFAVIPAVKPIHTFAITVAFQTVRSCLLQHICGDVEIVRYRYIWANFGRTHLTSHSLLRSRFVASHRTCSDGMCMRKRYCSCSSL